ncbi:hypothetical protein [Neobacillus sp. FSL H8-0543]|uniref:hypothetical protein n=1 Tax=Neobacillus sp. FSL H8-0543 TaxID=2954672 RepID=UPI00315988DA
MKEINEFNLMLKLNAASPNAFSVQFWTDLDTSLSEIRDLTNDILGLQDEIGENKEVVESYSLFLKGVKEWKYIADNYYRELTNQATQPSIDASLRATDYFNQAETYFKEASQEALTIKEE